ncbi:MAG: TonB-dependent receptor plug domain-containing protein, partial [Paramuribaculum sp.]|nr:TonB-dependent receptor plug domain-containing protein [Paramuribaculum sp.]
MFLRKILFIASAVVYLFVNTDYCLAQHTYDESRPNDNIQNRQLDAVVVTAQSARQRLERIGLGVEYIELATMAKMPMLFGENDIIKSISLLPGVRAEGDGSGGFEVRGGNSAQNLIMLDGITLYNPSHVLGIFSTFNDKSLARATLHKGPIPPGFGGATSSVLETSLAPGDMERY